MHGLGRPSSWVQRHAGLLRPGSRVLDLACGAGRHLRWLAAQGHAVTGVDRDAAALATLADLQGAELVQADLEGGPWPLPGRQFDGLVVTNYLWRPLFPACLAALAEGGVYLHETYADGHQHVGRPARPDFLLQRGELLRVCAGLRIVAFEDGFEGGSYVQRIAAVYEAGGHAVPPRYALGPDLQPGG